MGKRKASRKKNKKIEGHDSNNQNLHGNNNSSTHSQGSVDDSKSWEERDSDGGEREREEEEVVDQREVDAEKDEGLRAEVVQVAIDEKSLENGSRSADYSAGDVAVENPIADFTREEDLEDKEVAVEEEDEKSVITQFEEQKPENVDYAEEEAPVENEEDLKEVVELAPKEFTSAGAERLVMLVQADELGSELAKNVDSSFSQASDEKEVFPSAVETEKSEQVENPIEAVPVDDQGKSVIARVGSDGAQIENPVEAVPIGSQAKSVITSVVSNGAVNAAAGEPLETDVAVMITSREVDNGKEFEIQKKPSEESPAIGSIPFPVRRTSWTGCCGLFEVFSGAK